ncbi:hypothetical protein BH18ACT4_BH18ACT4_02750 [soil metagenome]
MTASRRFSARGGFDDSFNGASDAFVIKVEPDGSGFQWSTYLGGAGPDRGAAIALGPAGGIYIVGDTETSEATFPATVGPDLTYNGGISDAFVAEISER